MTSLQRCLCILACSALPIACGSEFKSGGSSSETTNTSTNATTTSSAGGSAGSGGTATSGTATGGSTTGGAGGGDCAVDVKSVPAGWSGPFWRALLPHGANLPACDSTKEDYVLDLSVGTASCPCNCEAKEELCTIDLYRSESDGCSPLNDFQAVFAGCQQTTLGNIGDYFTVQSKPQTGDVCFGTPMPTSDDPTWEKEMRLCDYDVQRHGTCPDAVLPGYDAALCVAKVGPDAGACPADYPKLSKVYTDFVDHRGCEDDCSCSPGSTMCTGSVALYNNTACLNSSHENIPTNACTLAQQSIASVWYSPQLSGSCGEGSATVTGEVVREGEVYVCCSH